MFNGGRKDLSRSVGKQKLFDCVILSYVMALDLFIFLIVLNAFTSIVIILPMARKGASSEMLHKDM